MATHPVELEELVKERTKEEVAPVYNLPKDIHSVVQLLLRLFILTVPVTQGEGKISCKQAHHDEGEHESDSMEEVRHAAELVWAGILEEDG